MHFKDRGSDKSTYVKSCFIISLSSKKKRLKSCKFKTSFPKRTKIKKNVNSYFSKNKYKMNMTGAASQGTFPPKRKLFNRGIM